MTGLWGKKIGMTQVFDDNKVVPVTVIDISSWYVTHVRTTDRDGYNAVQIGCVRARYRDQAFSAEWLRQPKKYFSFIREIKLENAPSETEHAVGNPAGLLAVLQKGDKVDAFGTSKGRGFCGVIKRHGFQGPPGSHGDTMGRRPGSLSWMRAEGRVPKNKKLPGHFGNAQKVIRNLQVVTVKPEDNVVLIKGSVPGVVGSLIYLRKA